MGISIKNFDKLGATAEDHLQNKADADVVLGDQAAGLEDAKRLADELEVERGARLRLAAEYLNYRRRTEQEKARAADKGKRELLLQVLSVADDIEAALKASKTSSGPTAEGVRMIHRRVIDTLKANGVVGFESEGTRFDPELHEAFGVVETEEGRSGEVHQEMRRGYLWNGDLLRPALVMVSR